MAIYTSKYNRTQLDEGIGASYVPTLNSAPTTSTLTYTRSDLPSGSQTVSFVIGQMCRVAITGGYDFYVLKNVSSNTATWEKVINTDTTYSVMGASGSSHASGLTPDTPSTAGTTKFLREDGTWNTPPCVGEPIPSVYLGEPSSPLCGTIYFDTTTSKFYQRNWQNTSWSEIFTFPKAIGFDGSNNYEIVNGVVSQTAYNWSSNLWYVDFTGTWWNGQVGILVYYDYGYFSPDSYWFGVMPDSSMLSALIGCSTRTNLSGIPTSSRMCVATISTNQSSVSVSGGVSSLKAGYELHVIVKATAAVTITLPTSSPYINMYSDTTLSMAANTYAEINFISDGTNIYVRAIQ